MSTNCLHPKRALPLLPATLLLAACGGGAPTDGHENAEDAGEPPAAAPAAAPEAGGDAPLTTDEMYRMIGTPPYLVFPKGEDPVRALKEYVDTIQARPDVKEDKIQVQHILVGVGQRFGGASPEEAQTEAIEVLKTLAAANGENFDELVRKHTDDSPPGIYTMILEGEPDFANKVFLRNQMVSAFGDVGWKLRVGEVGISPYDPPAPDGKGGSPFGIHIIKRLE